MNILDILVIITLFFLIYKYYFDIYKKRNIGNTKVNLKKFDNNTTEDFSVDFSQDFENNSKENIFDTSMKYIELKKHKKNKNKK